MPMLRVQDVARARAGRNLPGVFLARRWPGWGWSGWSVGRPKQTAEPTPGPT